MTTLALDLATVCGWALLRADGRIESGFESFAMRAKEKEGARWVKFRHWLVEAKNSDEGIRRIVYERVVGGGPDQVYAQQIYGGFVAILQAFCEHRGIEYQGINVSTIKKEWTGKGNARKEEMMARCRELGFTPGDHNEADAIALLHVATGRVPQLPIERHVKRKPLRKNQDTKSRDLNLMPEAPF